MGHEVLTMPASPHIFNDKARHILKQVEDRLFPNRFSIQEKWLLKVYKSFKPDIVLCLTQALHEEVLLELHQQKIITICWWGDTAANMTKQGLLCYGWDFIFIKDQFAEQKLRSLDLNAHYLPEAMNPDWHTWCFDHTGSGILFAGNTYDYRHFLLRKLIATGKYQIDLYGNKPPRWAAPDIQSVYKNKYIVKKEKSLAFGNALACINSTAMSEFDSLNCRAFELAGAGGLQILEYRPAVEELFEPGTEILVYNSFNELTSILDRLITDRDAFHAVRIAGHRRASQEHTYAHRLTTMLNHLA